jgi:hypothetical protein
LEGLVAEAACAGLIFDTGGSMPALSGDNHHAKPVTILAEAFLRR